MHSGPVCYGQPLGACFDSNSVGQAERLQACFLRPLSPEVHGSPMAYIYYTRCVCSIKPKELKFGTVFLLAGAGYLIYIIGCPVCCPVCCSRFVSSGSVKARGLDTIAIFENYKKPGQAAYGHVLQRSFWRVARWRRRGRTGRPVDYDVTKSWTGDALMLFKGRSECHNAWTTSRTLKFTLLTLFQHDTCGLQRIGLTRPFCVARTARSDFHTRLNL